MSSLISITGVDIAYEFPNGTLAFRNLNFSFSRNTYGFIGPNGSGKSTVIKLMSEELSSTQGVLSVRGTVAVLPQILCWADRSRDFKAIADVLNIRSKVQALKQVDAGHGSLEVLEIIGDDWNLLDRVDRIFGTLGIAYLTLDHPVAQLSGGELVKVHLAGLQLKRPDILLLDEPTNNLDSGGRQALYEFITHQGQLKKQCVIVVSHDRALLSCVNTIAELSNLGVQFYGGNYDFYLRETAAETRSLGQKIGTADQEQKRQKAELQCSLERQQRRMVRGERKAAQGGIPTIVASGLRRKAQSTLARVKNIQEDRLQKAQLELKHLKSQVKERNQIQIDIPETWVHARKEILEIKDFNFRFADSSSTLFPRPISFHLIGASRAQISGPNGAGKSTLIKLLLQTVSQFVSQFVTGTSDQLVGETSGNLQLKTKRVAYLDQNVEILGEKNISLLDLFSTVTPHLSESERRIRLGRFLFNQDTTTKKVGALSGGEKMRAALACVLFSEVPPELLILDEPTNNLDIDSIERMESALSHFQGAILAICHDQEFLTRIGITEELSIPHRHSKVSALE